MRCGAIKMLEAKGLSKTYGSVKALCGFTAVFEDSKITIIAGPSGSGKTTLLKLLAGLEMPTSGSIFIDGRDVTREPPWERGVMLLSQRPVLLPHLTVRKNLELASKYGFKGKNSAVKLGIENIVGDLGITDILDRYPGQLSGGQLQRASLAAVLASGARVLLLDEPFAHLDLPLREQLRIVLRKIVSRYGLTGIMVTHDQDEALELGDHIILLDSCMHRGEGSPAEMYFDPPTLDAARFFGLNIICGALIGDEPVKVSFAPEQVEIIESSRGDWILEYSALRRGFSVALLRHTTGVGVKAYVPSTLYEKLYIGSRYNIVVKGNVKKWNIEC